MKRFSWLTTLVLAVLLTPLLAQAQPIPEPDATTDATSAAEHYQPGRITWQPCPENVTLECGTLTLPVDYRKPKGETFDMAVIRAAAIERGQHIGVLVTAPGGPGQSGVDTVLGAIQLQAPIIERLRERFDVVSFDPRGVARSHPVTCQLEPAGQPTDLDDAALAAFFDDFSRRVAAACLDQNGPFVLSMSTNNIARDVDMLRRALDEKQITIFGGSYGTVTGVVYASLFPKRVRALVLDGGVTPDFDDYWLETILEQSASLEIALHHVDQLCQRDPACALRDVGVVAALDTVVARLQAEPVMSPEGGTFTGSDAQSVIATLLYNEQRFPLIIDALTNALAGDYTRFVQLLPTTRSLIRLALDTATFDAYDIITCNDTSTHRFAAETLPVDAASTSLTQHFFGRFYLAGEVARCAAWPSADPPMIENVRRQVSTPILLIGNQFDPATPLNWTRRLAGALGMEHHLVRYQGGGHVAGTKNIACIDDIVLPYVFDLKLPTKGSTCPARPIAFTAAAPGSTQALDATLATLWSSAQPLPTR